MTAQTNPRPWERIVQLEGEIEQLTKALSEAVEGAAAEAQARTATRIELGAEIDRLRKELVAGQATPLARVTNEAYMREAKALGEALGLQTPWPVFDVLERLADVAAHLRGEHNCDRHGEGDLYAHAEAEEANMRKELAQSGVKLRR